MLQQVAVSAFDILVPIFFLLLAAAALYVGLTHDFRQKYETESDSKLALSSWSSDRLNWSLRPGETAIVPPLQIDIIGKVGDQAISAGDVQKL